LDSNTTKTPVTAGGQPPSWLIITSKYGETWRYCFLRNHLKWITETRIYGAAEIYMKLILLLFLLTYLLHGAESFLRS
jgi:hypothetical protein